ACVDLAVEELDPRRIDDVAAVAFAVPMHTATRVALAAVEAVRGLHPDMAVCLFGLYAEAGAEALRAAGGGAAFAGEYVDDLVRWAGDLARSPAQAGEVATTTSLTPSASPLPLRTALPGLDRYAGLAVGDEVRTAGYVEATRGCTQSCRHCPVPVVYRGRLRKVDPAAVLADVDQLVEMGARHITFGDPDFLCSPPHARRVVEALTRRHGDITFDVTTKVSHILANADLWPGFAAAGLLFVTTAVECLDDTILSLLDKGHTAADAHRAVALLESHGIDARPSFLPFTPWTTLDGVADILDFVLDHDMVDVVEAVQYSLRLLIPPGSLLLDLPELAAHLDGYDRDRFTWDWHAADARVDALSRDVAAAVETAKARGDDPSTTFGAVYGLVAAASGRDPGRARTAASAPRSGRPRLTEAWFCCAEPTADQLAPAELDRRC
ncbi:MAG: radical SAM protein, partial [Acidimicrobiia bacterium]|nr:radical SAM protein [Acidimicrobiia bacterium]